MQIMYFTEQAMSAYPEEEVSKDGGWTVLDFSNRHFNAPDASRLYNEYLELYRLAEDVGYDGIMLNEHQFTPFCMQAKISIWAAALAAATERVKIVLLGLVLPVADNPVELATHVSMIDLISQGRLVPGIVRGGGTEQFAGNANPAYNRDRFQEAHDLMIETWTRPGPFRWESEHYDFRIVNPWVLPLQKPHPRIYVPGVSSNETIEWAARHRYPYIGLATDVKQQNRIKSIYTETAHEVGFEPGPESYGQLLRVHVQDTEEKAEQMAREFTWMQGEFAGVAHPVWSAPSGYLAPARRRALVERVNGRTAAPTTQSHAEKGVPSAEEAFRQQIEAMQIIYGTPDQVIEKLRTVLSQTQPGIFGMWSVDGRMPHEDAKRCVELIGAEVLPALRDLSDELGLNSPEEAGVPVSLATTPPEELHPQPRVREEAAAYDPALHT